MKILFLLRHGLYLRNFEAPIRALADRGHRIHLGFTVEPHHDHLDVDGLARDLAAAHEGVSHGFVPERTDVWVGLLRDARSARNLLQYYDPRFASASKLRKRVWRSASGPAQRFVRFPGMRSRRGRRFAHALLRHVEQSAPADPAALAYLAQQAPDVLFVSPYVDTKFDQVDFVKAARELGIPTVYGVASWDNLTTKGTIHVPPERVLVWNDAQAREAVEIHGVPRERIEITGAQLYDQWFSREPSRSREAFCELHGFDPRRPIALYVGSSGFIAEEELPFVTRWLASIRECGDPLVREANVLVRPHPTNARSWADANLESFGCVAVWPRNGAVPINAESKSDYFDTLFHAAGIVGINTSALVEAGILGKRPLTMLDPAFELTQEGTLHFAHLTAGEYLRTARSFEEHLAHLGVELRRHAPATEAQDFVRRFLRPHGVDVAATPRFVAAIEEAAAHRLPRRSRGGTHRLAGAAMAPLAALRRRQIRFRTQTDRRRKMAERRASQPTASGSVASAEPSDSRLAPSPGLYCSAGGIRHAVEAARQSPAWRNYCRARDYVRGLLQIPADAPSAYWREELAGFEYLLDASPLVVERLRQHAYHITGIRPHDFAPDDREGRRSLGEKLAALRALDRRNLLVPESRALGGFGFDIRDELFNVDTLKFYECLLTLNEAGCLPADDDTRRRVVLEIGAGWGGFAYQFLTRFPGRATYVIVDLPPTLLFSATYLPTMFPQARVAMVDADNLEATLAEWASYDVIFIPAGCWSQVRNLPVELAINMVSFQEMTARQVDQYAALLADLGCSKLYSLNRERSPHNCELTAVSAILGQYYDLQPLQLVDQQYTQWKSEKRRKRKPRDPAKDGSYQHLIGRLKPAAPAPVWMAESRRGRQACGQHRGRPRIGLAMPAYNETQNLRLAIESLQAQTLADFRLVVVDDSTSPEPAEIVRRYAAGDRRIEYRRNETRLGMVGNWRTGFEAFEPGLDYFAWVSDHDLWHPQWLEKLSATLSEFKEVSLVYPAAARMDAQGLRVFNPPHAFDTFGLSRRERFRRLANEGRSFGNMVYGLFRADRLREAGVFRPVLLPDVLLLWELSLQGTIKQIHEELWYRRYVHRTSLDRQRETLFAATPWYARLPWPLTHWGLLAWRRALAPGAGRLADRAFIARMAAYHARRYWGDLFEARDDDAPQAQHRIVGQEPIQIPAAPRGTFVESTLPGPHWDHTVRAPAAHGPDTL